MTVLPKLKVGCGLNKHTDLLKAWVCGKPHGKEGEVWLCYVCVVIRDHVLPVLKAHAETYRKDVAIWGNKQVMGATSLRNVYYNLGRAEGARGAVLEIAGLKNLETGRG